MPELLENMLPGGAKKFEKKTEEVPEASKKSPREFPRPKMRPTKSRVGLQNEPWDPRGAPEANPHQKDDLGSAQGTLLGGSPRERREQFYIVKTMLFAWFHEANQTEKQKIY